jgi:glycine/D-amino acid oxidase-like deaminating enzyme
MIGVSLGPVTGEIVSQIVAREKPSVDLSLLDVDRFR